MARYIDADALKEYVNGLSTHWLNEWDTAGVLAAVDKQPTVDAVEVVRCKDCAKSEPKVGGGYLCSRTAFKWSGLMCGAVEVKAGDFCSHGVKKEVQDG